MCTTYPGVPSDKEMYNNPWAGPEGSSRFRLPDFKNIGL